MDSAVEKVLKHVEEEYSLTIKELGSMTWPIVTRISSGSVALDQALGGGWPRGRFAEIFGAQSGGKTLLTLLAIAEAQKAGGRAVFIDVEHAFDPMWAAKLGVDVNKLYFAQPDYGEQALEGVRRLAESNEFDIIVLDSIAELLPKAELEGEIETQNIALQARMMSKALRTLSPTIGKTKAVALFVNQTRQSLAMYGDPTVTPGGQAFKFYASIRLQVGRVSKSERQDANKNTIGHDISAYVVKNKTASPFRSAIIPIEYLSGVRKTDDFIGALTTCGVVEWSGGVKYRGNLVTSIKETRWPSWGDFKQWLEDPANAAEHATLRSEVTNS